MRIIFIIIVKTIIKRIYKKRWLIIRQVSELLETGVYETFTPERTMTVKDLLKELNLEGKYFGVLVNGKKA